VSETGSTLLALEDALPGLGLFLNRKGRVVYAVEYWKDGTRIQKVIGRVNKISVKKARKFAAKLLSENQITTRPVQTETEARPVQPEIIAKPARPQLRRRPRVAKHQPESAAADDRSDQQETKALDEQKSTPNNPRRLATFDEIKEMFGIPYGRRQIDRLEAEGKFPKRVRIGESRVAWVISEIEAFVEQRMARR
jgi:prophage regulatory protein